MAAQIKNWTRKRRFPQGFMLILLTAVAAIFLLPAAVKAKTSRESFIQSFKDYKKVVLKPPQTALKVELEADEEGVLLYLQGWYYASIISVDMEVVQKLIKENDFEKLEDLAKKYLLHANQYKDGVKFWEARDKDWLNEFTPPEDWGPRNISVDKWSSERYYYTKKELAAARDKAISWANYIIKALEKK